MSFLLSPVCNESQIDDNGDPLSGGTVETYLAGTSTPAPTYTSITGATPQTNPIVLNTLGLPPQPIWLASELQYKFIIKDAVGNVQRTIDNIAGISSSIPIQDQWVIFGGVPTFIDATHLSLAGDQTGIFQAGRRLRTVNTGGVVYSTLVSAIFGAVTTITVVNDSIALDSGLSQVAYGLLSNIDPSIPATYARNSLYYFTGVESLTTTGSVAGTVGTFALTIANPERFPVFSLTSGYRIRVSFNVIGGNTNTLNVNGSGAFAILALNSAGGGLSYSPAIVTGHKYDIEYNGASWVVLNPVEFNQVGEYFWWPMNSTPSHGIACNGAAISRTTYARLFNRLGTFYGVGDGSTTFNVPNVPTNYTLLVGIGSEGSTTVGSVIAHTHLTHTYTTTGGGVNPSGGSGGAQSVSGDQPDSTGGGINMAAGMYARICIRF